MAASRIKGITVEIGGDTTKLDKALKGTNAELSNTKKSLQDVERLLKLDPKNTELLAQKQRLLSDSVQATADKLTTLKQVVEKADEAMERQRAYEAKYAPLKSELDKVGKQLKDLRDRAEETEASFQSGALPEAEYRAFQQALQDTEVRMKELRKEKTALDKEFKGTKLDQKQYDALQRELVQTEKEFKDAEDAARSFDTALGKMGPSLKNISEKAGKVSEVFKPISTAAAGVVAAAIATVPATEDLRTGLGNITLNAENAGISLGKATDAMKTMNGVSGDLDGAIEATNNLLNAGFTESNLQRAVENLAGAYIKFPETMKFESLADSLQETLATGEATGQFGELLDRLGVGAEAFNAQLAAIPGEVERQNYALGLLASQGLEETYQGWTKNNEELLQGRNASLEMQLALARLAESIQPTVTAISQAAAALLNWFNDLPDSVKIAIGVFALLLAAISPIAGVISAIGVASTVSGLAFSKWALIIAGVVVALAALAAIIAVIIGKGDEMTDTIGSVVDSVSGVSAGSVSTARRASAPAALSAADLPHFADGGVFRPNSPLLGVLGDNPREVEVAAPRSTIVGAVLDAMSMQGAAQTQQASGPMVLEMTLDGTRFARLFIPYLRPGLTRAGIKLS